MANQSIYKAFERMWTHITGTFAKKTEVAEIIDDLGAVTIDIEDSKNGITSNVNADTFGGQLPDYYAAKNDLENYLPLTGGELTDTLTIPTPLIIRGNYPGFDFKDSNNNKLATFNVNTASNADSSRFFYFKQYHPNTTHATVYKIPNPDADLTAEKWYTFYTTKNPPTASDVGAKPVRRAIVGQTTSTNTNPWYKFGYLQVPSGSHHDRTISFKVSQGYGDNNTYNGILTAHIRTGAVGVVQNAQLTWEVAGSGVVPSDWYMCYTADGTNPVVVELWAKQDYAYAQFHLEVISEHSRTNWTNDFQLLTYQQAGFSAELPSTDDGWTQVQSTLPVIQANATNTNRGGYTIRNININTSAGSVVSTNSILMVRK